MKDMFTYFATKSATGDVENKEATEKSDESTIASPDSVTTSHDEQTATYKVTSRDSQAAEHGAISTDPDFSSSHECVAMSVQTETTAKKRLPSSSPDDQSRIVSKTPKLDDRLAELLSAGADFAEKPPNWQLLFTTLEASYMEIKKMSAKMDTFASFKAEVTNKMATMEEKMDHLASEVSSVKTELSSTKAENAYLKAENESMKGSIIELASQVDRNEQHSRSECLLLHGVPEKKGPVPENSKVAFAAEITSKIGVKMSEKDIKRAHRYGPVRKDGKPRPIIARFWNSDLRSKVYRSKKNLKGKNVFITENLTKLRMGLQKKAIEDYGKENVWSMEGRIYARDKNLDKVLNIIS